MSELIIATNPLKLSDKFFIFTVENTTIEIDLQSLFKSPNDSEDAWINITPILQSDFSRIKKIANWLRIDGVKEYVNIVHREIFKGNARLPLKLPFKKSQYLDKDWLDEPTPLIVTRRGKYHSGTWLHKEIFVEFLTTLNVKLRRQLHKAVTEVITTANVMKVDRQDTKTRFHPLADAIKDKWIPTQSDNGKRFAYSNILDLGNYYGIGMRSRAFKKLHGLNDSIIKADGNISIRDYMTKSQLDAIKQVEQVIHGLIEYGEIRDFSILKEKLEDRYNV